MNVVFRIPSNNRLVFSSILIFLGVLSFVYVYKYETGFPEGLITGILIGIGIVLVTTYKKIE